MNAVLSSLTTNAGSRTSRVTSLLVAGRGSLDRSMKTCRSSVRVSLSMNWRNGSMPFWMAVFWSMVLFR